MRAWFSAAAIVVFLLAVTALFLVHEFPPTPRTIGQVCTLRKVPGGPPFGDMYYWQDTSGKVPDGICADMYPAGINGWGVDLPRPHQATLTQEFPTYDAAVAWVESQPYLKRHTR
jgi:hypothetical protein